MERQLTIPRRAPGISAAAIEEVIAELMQERQELLHNDADASAAVITALGIALHYWHGELAKAVVRERYAL